MSITSVLPNPDPVQTAPQHPKALPVVVLAALLGTMAMSSFNAVIGPVVRGLGLAEWHGGLAMACGGFFWMLLGRQWGALSDRVGRRAVLLSALAICALIYLSLAVFVDLALRFQPAVWFSVLMLVGIRAAIGAFHSALPATAAAAVADESLPGERGSAMAKFGAANSIGMIIGPALAGWFATKYLAIPLYVAAGLPLIALILLWNRLPVGLPAGVKKPGLTGKKLSVFDPRIRMPATVALVAMLSVSIAQVCVGFLAIDRFNLSKEQGAVIAGFALTAVGIGLSCSQALVIRFRSVKPSIWIRIGTFISSIGFASVMFLTVKEHLPLAYGLAAFGMGFTVPSLQALVADAVDQNEQGVAAGTIASMQGLGMAIGPLLGTILYQVSPTLPYQFTSGVLLTLCLVVTYSLVNRHES